MNKSIFIYHIYMICEKQVLKYTCDHLLPLIIQINNTKKRRLSNHCLVIWSGSQVEKARSWGIDTNKLVFEILTFGCLFYQRDEVNRGIQTEHDNLVIR